MSAERPSKHEIFNAAAELADDAERRAFLDKACGNDVQLREEIENLLQRDLNAGSFLESPPPGLGVTISQPPREKPGTQIGPYKLLQQIGEGGFGVVYMAEQLEPVRRKVALKLIKPGMDTRQVIARFEAERQALAVMDHPNIARVFDAGATESGRPYFVMELVRGIPITQYCDENQLAIRERLELFSTVCQAIQHAHTKGIIHRDIKPTNVLVTRQDGNPIVKVIDFGVAKAMGQQLTEKTLFTEFAQMIGTPLYMSPEQAELSSTDIDTRSDIYSLGALLYELLTGSTPVSKEQLKQAALDEIRRIIREDEPQKPSTRISTAEAAPSIAAQRHTEPAKLAKLIRGELDWIVMKALEKDRNRRYETASGFARDVQRYLNDEQVQACPPSAAYRFRKFARRNKGGLAMAALVLFFLVLLGSVAGWAWRDRAARAAERANHLERAVDRAELLQREGKRGEALAALERVQLLAGEAEPAPPLAERIEALQLLLDAEGRDEAFLARFEAVRREVQTEVDLEKGTFSSGYPKIREALEQYGIAPGVTPPAAAVAHIQKRPAATQAVVVAALDEFLAHTPRDDSGAREWLIDVLQKADGDPWRNKVRRARKQPAMPEALVKDIAVRQQPPSFLLLVVNALPIESQSRWDLDRRVQFAYPGDFWANHQLGSDLYHAGKHAEAVRYYTAALALRPDNPGVLLNRAHALRDTGELEAAVADLQRAIAVSPRNAHVYSNLGALLCDDLREYDRAIESLRTAIELDPKHANARGNLGVALGQKGWDLVNRPDPKARDPKRALEAVQEAVELDPRSVGAWQNLGWVRYQVGDWRASIEALEKSCKLQEGGTGDAGQWIVMALAHARLATQEGLPEKERAHHKAEARRWFDQADKQIDSWWRVRPGDVSGQAIWDFRAESAALLGLPNPERASDLFEQAQTLRDQKKFAEAETILREVIRLKPAHFQAQETLGWVLQSQGKFPEMEAAFREVVRVKPDHAAGHHGLGRALLGQKKSSEAIASLREAIRLGSTDHWVYAGLGWALVEQGQFAEAEAAFREVVRLKPDLVNGHSGLGMALADQKKFAEAEEALREALRLEPTHPWASELLVRALVGQGKSAEAEELKKKSEPKPAQKKEKPE